MTTTDLNGRVALVTGANTGIGRVTARELALRGAHVFLACRSQAKTQVVLDEIAERSQGKAKAEFIALDLGDLASVRRCADEFLARDLPLHLLINNAGLAGQKGMTASGFELTFGTNHVGPFLLTRLLIEKLKASAPARIVVVASKAHRHVSDIDFSLQHQATRSIGGLKEYSVSKLANILFVDELARRLMGTGVHAYALHPGVVASEVWRGVPDFLARFLKLFMLSPEAGAATTLYCATSSQCAEQSGLYYDDCAVREPSFAARNHELADRLWRESEAWTQAWMPS